MARGTTSELLAVLIDGDNFPADLADVLFSALPTFGTLVIRRVYGGNTGVTGWREAATKHGIAIHEAMPGKNATDMRLTIDAMDILHRGKIHGFCIVSSDSDFAELARRLREDGVAVHGFGENKAAARFRQACDTFMIVSKSAVPKQVVQLSVASPRAEAEAERAAWTKLLVEVLSGLPSGTTQLALSALGKQVRQVDESFSPSKYGSTSLKALIMRSGLQVNKVKDEWIAVVPKALRRAA